MRHGNALRQLSRPAPHRVALLKNLTTSLVLQERITTTLAKAKELRRVADQTITRGKREREMCVRQRVFDPAAATKVLSVLAPRYAERQGGYTRVVRIGPRQGDGAQMAVVELVGRPGELSKAVRWAASSTAITTSSSSSISATAAPRKPRPLVDALGKPLVDAKAYCPPRFLRAPNWTCPLCRTSVSGQRDRCFKCTTANPRAKVKNAATS